MKVKNKIFVVTGGGNGIGRELVLELLNGGARVAAVDKDEPALQVTSQLAGDMRNRLTTHVVDITIQDSVQDLPEQIIKLHEGIDGIINDAGIIQPFDGLKNLDYDTIRKIMDTNFYGTLYITKAFLPYLLLRPEAHITNISSMGGFLPVPGQTLYGASKAAVKILTEGLSTELMGTNVRVTVVYPGGVGTDIMRNSGVKMSPKMEQMRNTIKILSPKKAAHIIIKGIEKNRYRILVGTDAVMMDFLYRLNPRLAARLLNLTMTRLLGD